MGTKITVLCENLVGRRVGTGEHGFSAFIETEEGITSSIPEVAIHRAEQPYSK